MARSTLPNLAASGTTTRGSAAASETRSSLPVNLFLSLRPGQWTKNLLVFAALIFAVKLFDAASLRRSIAGFVVFCGLSGVVYLVNDIMDRDNDRQHPLKRHRPIASGALPVRVAAAAAAVIGGAAVTASFSESNTSNTVSSFVIDRRSVMRLVRLSSFRLPP